MDLNNNHPKNSAADELTRFREDDLEFRTITTILSKLGSRDDRRDEKKVLAPSITRHLKLLASISAMLVMNHEVIAIMPKRSGAGLTLFLCLQSYTTTETNDSEDHDDHEDDSSGLHFITKNPRVDDHLVDSVKFMDIPGVEIGTDIFKFITENCFGAEVMVVRKQSFEQHAQATANLISACHSGSKPEWLRLAHYAIFQSAAKVERHFKTTRSFELLETLPPPSEPLVDFPGFSGTDKFRLRAMLLKNSLLQRFPLLRASVDPAQSAPHTAHPLPLLTEFHGFFVMLLREAKQNVVALHLLRQNSGPPSATTLSKAVQWAYGILEDLHYLVWQSKLFDWYILKYQRQSISDHYGSSSEEDDDDDTSLAKAKSMANDELDQDQNYEQGDDFLTDYEMCADQADSTVPANPEQEVGPADQTYSWLRLVTSIVQHAHRFQRTTPGPRTQFDFQVITYPKSDRMMRPWLETIAELAGGKDREREILDAIGKKPEFAGFVTRNRTMKFNGRAHCEAVLGCLHSLAKCGENLAWAGVPQRVMNHLKTSYSIVAPSKRCCPVCATLIASLSREKGGPILNTLTKHPFIFPTAFPVGLPGTVRRHLLEQYGERLRQELDTLVVTARKSSSLSVQSEQLSVGSDDDDTEATAQEQRSRLEDSSRLWLLRWFDVPEPERRKKWQELHDDALDMWECCRRLIRFEERGMHPGSLVSESVSVNDVENVEGEQATELLHSQNSTASVDSSD